MPFATPFDELTPTDASWAHEGDDEIRKIKRALNERLGPLFSNWPDGAPDDMLLFSDEAIQFPHEVVAGDLADKPNPPEALHQLYIAEDTDQQFVSLENPDGSFYWFETKKAQAGAAVIVLSAGETRFAPDGDESDAQRVRNAILTAQLSTAPVKAIFVPRSMWGYVADADFNPAMFDAGIFMVREGSIAGWYDPVAYGADVTGDVNSQPCIDVAFSHASQATASMKVVAFTVPGNYSINTDVDRRGCGIFFMPDAELIGPGELTGTVSFEFPAVSNVRAFTYNADAAANARASEVEIAHVLKLRVTGTADGDGKVFVNFSEEEFEGRYSAANVISCVATYRTQATSSLQSPIYIVDVPNNRIELNLDGGSQEASWDLEISFSA